MQLVYGLENMPVLSGSVVTDGMFDGVHLGHQSILRRVVQEAKALGLVSVLLTYWPHPRHILGESPDKLPLLTGLQEKARIVEEQGIDYMLVIDFNPEFSRISHETFVRDILVNGLSTRRLIVGYDHRFGVDRMGDVQYLHLAGGELGFDVLEIGKQEIEEIGISSTRIRQAILHHEMETATRFLGRFYSVSGLVVEGDKRGRTIGFPTANLKVSEEWKLIPANGAYATRAWLDNQVYGAMTNIGFRPTVDGFHHKIETHIFDFQGDIYGKQIEIEFVRFLRPEMKFSGLDALTSQLTEDERLSRGYLTNG